MLLKFHNIRYAASTIFRRSLSIPSQIPSKALVNLGDASKFIKIYGEDAALFINGLTTAKLIPKHLKKNQTTISEADVNNENIINSVAITEDDTKNSNWGILHEAEEYDPSDPDELPMRIGVRRDGRFGHMLKANGRVLTDVFIYPTPFMLDKPESTPSYLIEVLNTSQFKPLQMMLKLHKLKSKVQFEEVNLKTWFYYNDTTEGHHLYDLLLDSYFANGNSKSPKDACELVKSFLASNILLDTSTLDPNVLMGFAIDQRVDYFGLRIVAPESWTPSLVENMQCDVLPYETYLSRRIEMGVTEVSDFQKIPALPFECNLDWMRGINYDKGCYMGQELTIRTWSGNGTARRVLPVIFDQPIASSDSFDQMELKPIKTETPEEPQTENPVYNPFGASSVPIRSRRKSDKVGEVFLNNGHKGLARVEKKYFDWDNETTKRVEISYNGKSYTGTISTSVWN
ncbi:hypothetical protein CANINC_001881 [Pichia inconspicua]|uniref:Uncharacterized protein n=1 Tax=Pichia inconspicua TaxID=52247 RepID=A0A4T0X2R8_9ASCO|nr:hypothetical protein CANINC_001881 [[Candida] inconspicua]